MKKQNIFAVGIDIGGTNIKIGVVSTDGVIIKSNSFPTGKKRKEILQDIKNSVKRLLEESRIDFSKIAGIGADTPGLADSKGYVVTGAYNIPEWNGTDLGDFLRKTFKLPVKVENDVTALTLGESLFGNAKPFSNFISLAFGTGLGGGVIIDNKIYRGRDGYAAEFGHMVVDSSPNAAKCTCGGRGCLEAYASAVGIKRIILETLKNYKYRTLLNEDSTPADLYNLAKKKETLSLSIVKFIGEKIGAGIASLVNIFNPEAVLLGGGIVNAGNIFFKSFMPSYKKHVLKFYNSNKVKFIKPKLGSEGGIVGAAGLILQDYL